MLEHLNELVDEFKEVGLLKLMRRATPPEAAEPKRTLLHASSSASARCHRTEPNAAHASSSVPEVAEPKRTLLHVSSSAAARSRQAEANTAARKRQRVRQKAPSGSERCCT